MILVGAWPKSERLPNYACFPPLVRFAAEAAFVADVDAAFVQKILNIPQRERKPHIHHHSQADDLGARLEVTKGETLCHRERLGDRPARLNRFCSDSAGEALTAIYHPFFMGNPLTQN